MDGEMERGTGRGSRALKLRAGRWETLAEADCTDRHICCVYSEEYIMYIHSIQTQEPVRRNAHANTAKKGTTVASPQPVTAFIHNPHHAWRFLNGISTLELSSRPLQLFLLVYRRQEHTSSITSLSSTSHVLPLLRTDCLADGDPAIEHIWSFWWVPKSNSSRFILTQQYWQTHLVIAFLTLRAWRDLYELKHATLWSGMCFQCMLNANLRQSYRCKTKAIL